MLLYHRDACLLVTWHPEEERQRRHICSAAVVGWPLPLHPKGGREGNLRATDRTLVPTHPPLHREFWSSLWRVCISVQSERQGNFLLQNA